MFAVVGNGGAGGNIADLATRVFGIPSVAVNTSQNELNGLKNVKSKFRLIGSEGVGHNRNEAQDIFANQYQEVVDFIKQNLNQPSIEIVFVAFSTGGGTGSGISPMLIEMCSNEMPEKTFVAMPILPDLQELVVPQMNSSKTSEELAQLQCAILPIDNQAMRNMFPNIGKDELYQQTNAKALQLLDRILSYTTKQSKVGNFDRTDLRTIFNTKGVCTISELGIAKMNHGKIDLSREGVANSVQNSWKNTVFTPVEYKKVVNAGIVFDGDPSMLKFIDPQLIFSKFELGMPIDLFDGGYDESDGQLLTILSGLAWNSERMGKIDQIIQESNDKIALIFNEEEDVRYKSSANSIEDMIRSNKKSSGRTASDVLNKYKRK